MMRVLITGGAGFISSNLAARAIDLGWDVVILDNLSRPGSSWNLEWLQSKGPFEFVQADIRDFASLLKLFRSQRFDAVFHLAAQVAVTTSVQDPRLDFETNALGTFNLLESLRLTNQNPVFIFASTNKVYGSLSYLAITEQDGHYTFRDIIDGVSEETPLDFHSPYGCSKGCADQYVLDYRRIYGLRTIVFRQSCIYGPRQLGLEDQGWVAWFAIRAVLNRPITIYGDGKQIRDLLYIHDLVDLYFQAVEQEPELKHTVFNVGGGPQRAVSLLEVLHFLEISLGRRVEIRFSDWRPGDQRVYISDIRRAEQEFKWSPRYSVEDGIKQLLAWIQQEQDTLVKLIPGL